MVRPNGEMGRDHARLLVARPPRRDDGDARDRGADGVGRRAHALRGAGPSPPLKAAGVALILAGLWPAQRARTAPR
jgi:hypothetical protein